jgi:hypothetical protein
MNIKQFDILKDGGTISIKTDEGYYCFDRRLNSTTKNKLYVGYPKPDNSNQVKDEDSLDLEKRILNALQKFRLCADIFYFKSIDDLIQQLDLKIWVNKKYNYDKNY